MTELVAEITQADCDTLLLLHKRIRVLERIKQIKLDKGIDLSDYDISEINKAELDIEACWSVLSEKYRFPTVRNKKWTIDFYSNKIYIID